jgi:signal transduction histidine kinase
MRKYLLLFFFLVSIVAFTQQSSITDAAVVIRQLPMEGIVLDKGWKFQTSDNPAYADPGFDDRNWQPIDPTKDIHELPQLWKGIGWLRLHFTMDSTIMGTLVMEIQQSGASEIFLNGKLLHRFGVVSTNSKAIKAFSPLRPLSLPSARNTVQVLAVRYALQPHIQYSTHFGTQNRGLSIVLNTIENGNYQYEWRADINGTQMLRVGVFSILCVLYFAFYLFNRIQKVNLLFSLYAFIQAIVWALFVFGFKGYVQPKFLIDNVSLIMQVLSFFFLVMAIYRLLEQKRGWIFYTLIVLGIISIPIGAFFYGWGWNVFGSLFTNLVNVEITRIALKAVRNHKKGAWIIAAGGISCLVFWILFMLQWNNVSTIFGIDTFTLAFISIPVAVSIYLGYDFALTYRSLQQKFMEVESLSREKQQILEAQKETLEQQVKERTAALHQSLNELRTTQTQLVQREKMASLGELAAGIAHEIQNPLNFVNNFSETNTELLAELKQEAIAGNINEVIALTENIEENEQKITHHGKRADSIVKGMLFHARSSTGTKERTNLNRLADEHLRLSYQGMRAKNKEFNATIQTNFNETVGEIEVVPNDMGRVLLNLFNNAFYAVHKRKLQLNGQYEPTVSVHTKRQSENIEIIVHDNGTGMSPKVAEKVFQPFFTTKPTGEGTGLGLSLSYDIITKGHGGELKVESKEGEGSTFVVQLPI